MQVVIYHLTPVRAPQGYLGVDIFFVLSGFLITYLLATEISRTGSLDLAGFWLRRAHRILPALVSVLLITAPLTLLVRGDSAVGLPRQVASTLTFTYNWADIVAGSDYADATTPALLKNMWSLAVEEQFYLLWPLVILAVLRPAHRSLARRDQVDATGRAHDLPRAGSRPAPTRPPVPAPTWWSAWPATAQSAPSTSRLCLTRSDRTAG